MKKKIFLGLLLAGLSFNPVNATMSDEQAFDILTNSSARQLMDIIKKVGNVNLPEAINTITDKVGTQAEYDAAHGLVAALGVGPRVGGGPGTLRAGEIVNGTAVVTDIGQGPNTPLGSEILEVGAGNPVVPAVHSTNLLKMDFRRIYYGIDTTADTTGAVARDMQQATLRASLTTAMGLGGPVTAADEDKFTEAHRSHFLTLVRFHHTA